MKHGLRLAYHMIAWSMFLFLCQGAIKEEWTLILFGVISGLVAGVCYFLRRYVKKIGVFVGTHALFSVLCIYGIGVMYGNGVLAFMLILPIFWSVILRLLKAAQWLENPSGIYVGGLVVVYFIHWIYKVPQYIKTMTVVAAVVLFLVQLLYKNVDAADKFVDMRTMSTKMNTKSVKSLSKHISTLYVGALGCLLGILGIIGADGVWQFLAKVGDRVMRFLVSLIPQGEKPVYEQKFEGFNNNNGEGLEALAKENAIMQKIGEVIAFIGGIAIGLALVFLLIKGIIALVRYFNQRAEETEEDLVREKLYVGKEKSTIKKKSIWSRREHTQARKVRKIYKRNLSKLGEKELQGFPYLSPKEQVDKLPDPQVKPEEKTEVLEIYERARYSIEKVSDADAKRLQEIM